MNNIVIDVFVGLTLIFCLYSFLATMIKELIASVFTLRAKELEKAITRMLTDENFESPLKKKLLDAFHNHALFKYMSSSKSSRCKPSYISPANFSKIMIDILKEFGGSTNQLKFDQEKGDGDKNKLIFKQMNFGLEECLKSDKKENGNENVTAGLVEKGNEGNIPKSDTVKLLSSFISDANNDIEKFKTAMEQWFNDTMDRTTGWYKRQSQWIILVIGFVLAIIFNVNTFEIIKNLSKDKTAREQMVSMGIAIAKDSIKYRPTISSEGDSVNRQALLDSTLNYIRTDLNKANSIMGLGWDFTSIAKDDSLALNISLFVKQTVLDKILELNKTIDTLEQNAIKFNEDSLRVLMAVNKKLRRNYIGIFNDSTQSGFITINKVRGISPGKNSYVVFGKIDAGFFSKVGYIIGQSFPWKKGFWGLFITALMISLGAPFWFDLLSKFIQIRNTGPRISTKPPVSIESSVSNIDQGLSIISLRQKK